MTYLFESGDGSNCPAMRADDKCMCVSLHIYGEGGGVVLPSLPLHLNVSLRLLSEPCPFLSSSG